MRIVAITSVLIVASLLSACGPDKPSASDIRAAAEQKLPGLLELEAFNLEQQRNIGSEEQPIWVARAIAKVAVREPTYEIETVEDGTRILKQVRAAGETLTRYGTVRSERSGESWTHSFQSDGSGNPELGRPRSDYGPDALIAGTPEATALLARIEEKKQKARIAEEARIAAEAAEQKRKDQAAEVRRKRVEAAVAKYHAAFATADLGKMVDPGTRRTFLVTADASGSDRVWGTDIYTCGSSFAKAVVHAGVLKDGEIGIVEVAATPQRQHGGFVGSPRHGVSSDNYTGYSYGCAIRLLERISSAP